MPFESLASENRGIDVDSSLFGGKNHWHLKVVFQDLSLAVGMRRNN